MAAHLTEEEQIEALKRWWKENGKSSVAIVVVMLAGFFGWNQYKDLQKTKADDGSVIFEELVTISSEIEDKASTEQEAKIQSIASELVKHDGGSLYSDFAQLHVAKTSMLNGDIESAITALEGVSQKSGDASIQELARLRLARLLADKGDSEQALKILSANVSASYKAAYAEARGDVLLSQNSLSDAHKAYSVALQSMGVEQMMRRNLVQLKIDHTAVATKTDASKQESVEPAANPHAPTEAGDA